MIDLHDTYFYDNFILVTVETYRRRSLLETRWVGLLFLLRFQQSANIWEDTGWFIFRRHGSGCKKSVFKSLYLSLNHHFHKQ